VASSERSAVECERKRRLLEERLRRALIEGHELVSDNNTGIVDLETRLA